VLPGVTRAFVMKVAKKLAPIEERRVTVGDLLQADEMFLTSSTVEIAPIVGVDRRRIGDGRPGTLTGEIQMRYRALVARRTGLRVEELD
jgi:branched-subunit amino acid aminotransferase/4-amino-4-deoxychorismate lyase